MADDPLLCFVEIPKGSRNKYEWDEDLGGIKLDRLLFSSVVYPTDYGFIPGTCGRDGDHLDALVCVSEPTFPGCTIETRPVGMFRMEDEDGVDDKIVCVPLEDPAWAPVHTLEDIGEALLEEIRHFFEIYKDLEHKTVSVNGWATLDEARAEIERARERFRAAGT